MGQSGNEERESPLEHAEQAQNWLGRACGSLVLVKHVKHAKLKTCCDLLCLTG